MGKNRKPNPKNANLGRTLIKEKNNARRGIGHVKDSWVGRFMFYISAVLLLVNGSIQNACMQECEFSKALNKSTPVQIKLEIKII